MKDSLDTNTFDRPYNIRAVLCETKSGYYDHITLYRTYCAGKASMGGRSFTLIDCLVFDSHSCKWVASPGSKFKGSYGVDLDELGHSLFVQLAETKVI